MTTEEKENVMTLEEFDNLKEKKFSFSDLEEIARKFDNLETPKDFLTVDIGLTQEEHYIMNVFRTITKAALFNEIKTIHDRISNHHHVTLSIDHGRDFRRNGNLVGGVTYDDEI